MFFIGPIEHDVLLTVGLLLAAILLAILAVWQVKATTSNTRMRLVGVLSIIGLASIGWALSEPISRLVSLRATGETVKSIHEFCFGLSDAELEELGIRPSTDTWERMPQDGYHRLITRAKNEGKLRDHGGRWSSDGQFYDFWMRPFRIAVSTQGGKRVVIVDSLGPDGRAGSIDDIQRSGSRETLK